MQLGHVTKLGSARLKFKGRLENLKGKKFLQKYRSLQINTHFKMNQINLLSKICFCTLSSTCKLPAVATFSLSTGTYQCSPREGVDIGISKKLLICQMIEIETILLYKPGFFRIELQVS